MKIKLFIKFKDWSSFHLSKILIFVHQSSVCISYL